mmetsp:Transcript_38275/g.118907  ORF Transcript_38275/g.118907 Transcript_38275/m.118907 type:complete len:89 (-) Transcript_38275:20-286(-)
MRPPLVNQVEPALWTRHGHRLHRKERLPTPRPEGGSPPVSEQLRASLPERPPQSKWRDSVASIPSMARDVLVQYTACFKAMARCRACS